MSASYFACRASANQVAYSGGRTPSSIACDHIPGVDDMRTVWRVVGWVVLFWVVLVVAFFLFFVRHGGLPSRTHPRYSKNDGCPTSPSGQIKWQPPLGGDSSTCTGNVVGTTATIRYFQSNYDAVLVFPQR